MRDVPERSELVADSRAATSLKTGFCTHERSDLEPPGSPFRQRRTSGAGNRLFDKLPLSTKKDLGRHGPRNSWRCGRKVD